MLMIMMIFIDNCNGDIGSDNNNNNYNNNDDNNNNHNYNNSSIININVSFMMMKY